MLCTEEEEEDEDEEDEDDEDEDVVKMREFFREIVVGDLCEK